MNRAVIALACVLMSACGLALAQSTPSQPQTSRESTPPSDSPQAATQQGAAADDKLSRMQTCLREQEDRAATSGMSKHDIEEYCKSQLKSAPHE
jgi:hypothetical protein